MEWWQYFLLILVPALISLLMSPVAMRAAKRWNLYDHPGPRKVHLKKKPYLGGLVIFLSFTLTSLFLLPVSAGLLVLLAGGAFFFCLGMLDDFYDLSPRLKLFVEIAGATLLVWLGMQTGLLLENPFGGIGTGSALVWFSIPFSVFWIVGVANAVNLIDGLDALASGVVIIACGVMIIAALISQAIFLSPLLLILLAALLGYIRFNLYPSKMIMGDSGSLFLGYAIAIISLSSFAVPDRSIFLSIIPPAMALFVPLFDAASAVVRRGRSGKRIFSADQNHIHHYLLDQGYAHPRAVRILWGLSLGFGGLSIILSELIFRQIYLALALLALVLGWTVFSSFGRDFFTHDNGGEVKKAEDGDSQ